MMRLRGRAAFALPVGSRKRARERGAAAVEFGLVIFVMAPLLLGIFDYGKYMYVSVTATEAARQAVRQLSQVSVGTCSSTTAVNAAITAAQASTGVAKVYMNQIGLLSATTVTATCGTAPFNPTWLVSLQIDYAPTIGYLTKQGLMPNDGGSPRKARVKSSFYMRGY